MKKHISSYAPERTKIEGKIIVTSLNAVIYRKKRLNKLSKYLSICIYFNMEIKLMSLYTLFLSSIESVLFPPF